MTNKTCGEEGFETLGEFARVPTMHTASSLQLPHGVLDLDAGGAHRRGTTPLTERAATPNELVDSQTLLTSSICGKGVALLSSTG